MMRFILLLLSAFSFQLSALPQSASLAADLQAADAAHWPAIEALLKAQRAELVAAHVATLKQAAQEAQAKAATDVAAVAVAKAEAASAKAEAQRLKDLLAAKLAAETKTGKGPKTALLEDLLTEAAKPERDLQRAALQAERDRLTAELAKLK